MLVHDAAWLGWSLLVVGLGLVVAGFIFSPWLGIAALGVAAFMAVMAMSFVIMAYGFNSITGINMSTHSLALCRGGVAVEFEDGKVVSLNASDVRPYHIYPGGVLMPVAGSRPGWLWVPPKAFESDEDFKEFLKCVYRNESNTE